MGYGGSAGQPVPPNLAAAGLRSACGGTGAWLGLGKDSPWVRETWHCSSREQDEPGRVPVVKQTGFVLSLDLWRLSSVMV